MEYVVRNTPISYVQVKGVANPQVTIKNLSTRTRVVQSASPIPVSGGANVHTTWTPPGAQATWLIPHNLGFKPQISILDPFGSVVQGDVQHLDLNTVSISFTAPFYGTAELG